MLDYDLICENIYKKYGRENIYFSEGLMSSILNIAKQSDEIVICLSDRNDNFLRNPDFGRIYVVVRKNELNNNDKKYIDIVFNEIYKNCKKHNHRQLHLCFEFYSQPHHNKVSVCETVLLNVDEAKRDLEDILKNSMSFYTNTYVASYFG